MLGEMIMESVIEVMHVIRIPPLGKLIVEVSGARYETLSDVKDPAARQRLIAAIGELVVFANGYEALVDAGVAPPAGDDELASLSMDERREMFVSSMKRQTDSLRMPEPATVDVVGAATDSSVTEESPLDPGLARIVSQINAILERKIQGDSELESRKIRVLKTGEGDLRIEVDGNYYRRPSEIEDEVARELVGAALKEFNSG
jgi:hypothetical protein